MTKQATTEVQIVTSDEVGSLPPGIIDPKTFSVPAVENPFKDDYDAFTNGLFLPRLQLEGSSSNLVKNRKVQAGTYIIISGKDQFQILGDQTDLLVLTYRSKALDLTDKKNIVACFDKNAAEFKRIQAASQNRGKGFLYGLEFLVYVPDSNGETKFATFFMGNPTMRVEAKNFKPICPPKGNGMTTLKVKLIENADYTWEAPVILTCSTPLKSYPSSEEMASQMSTFLDPPKGTVREEAPPEDAATETSGRVR